MTDDHIDAYCIAMDLCALVRLISRTWSADDPLRNALRNTAFTIPFALLESLGGTKTYTAYTTDIHYQSAASQVVETDALFDIVWQRGQISKPNYHQGKRLLIELASILLTDELHRSEIT